MFRNILFSIILVSSSFSIAAISKKGYVPRRETVIALLALSAQERQAALWQQPESIYSSLIDVAFDKKEKMANRWKALTAAAQFKKAGSVDDLMKAAQGEWFMKNAALVALNEVHPEKAHDLAKILISDSALVVRSAAVDVLSTKLDAETRGILFKELQQPYNFRNKQSLWIRSQILRKLANNPLKAEKVIFEELKKEKDQAIHFEADRALRSF